MRSPLTLPTEKEDLTLRELTTPKDDTELFGLIEANSKYWPDIAATYSDIDDVRYARLDAKEESELRFGIRNTGRLVGWVSLITYAAGDEFGNWLGYWVDQQQSGKGYGTLAARAAIKYVRDNSQFNRTITTTVRPDNMPSMKILARTGFQHMKEEAISHFPGEAVFKLRVGEPELL